MGVNDLSNDEFERLYGPWATHTPADVATLFEGYPGTWWIAGGWAIEAFTGVRREHEDTDTCVLRSELPLLRKHLADAFDLWAAGTTALRPLLPDDDPDGSADEVLWGTEGQLWTRRSAQDPWEYDLLLDPGTADEWVYRRDQQIRMPMSEALWERDGICYLRPEIQLLFKARMRRPKDQLDFDSTLPHLDARSRTWLRQALVREDPAHPWLIALAP